MKWRFALKFLAAFTGLVVVWWRLDVAEHYRAAALATARLVSPIVNGWWLEYDRPGLVDQVVFRSGGEQMPMLLQLQALSMGLMPFLSLVAATPGLRLRRGLGTAALGAALFFLVHVLIVLVYPLIMNRAAGGSALSTAVAFVQDTMGVFSGLIAFVVAPLGLWFGLTYPVLRSVWRVEPTG